MRARHHGFEFEERESSILLIAAAPVVEQTENSHAPGCLAIDTGRKLLHLKQADRLAVGASRLGQHKDRSPTEVRDVVGLYLDPPNGLWCCAWTKIVIQALDRTAPLLPLHPGLPERQTHDHQRHGTTILFAAINILKWQSDRHLATAVGNSFAFLNHLERQLAEDPPGHFIAAAGSARPP